MKRPMDNFTMSEIAELITAVKSERATYRLFCVEQKLEPGYEKHRLTILNVVLCKLMAAYRLREEMEGLRKQSKQEEMVSAREAFDERWRVLDATAGVCDRQPSPPVVRCSNCKQLIFKGMTCLNCKE
jgi:hypothetical protein